MNFEANKVQSKFDINHTWLPYSVYGGKSHHAENKKRRFPTQGHMKYSMTVWNKGSLAFYLQQE